MANIIDKFLNSMRLNDDDDYEDDDFDLDDEFEEEEKSAPRFMSKRRTANAAAPQEESYTSSRPSASQPQHTEPARQQIRSKKSSGNNVVPMRSRSSMEVCMFRPANMDDAMEVVSTLLSGRAVVINMEGVHFDMAQRIIDFTSGACYSMEGKLQSISKYIFIVTPSTIELSGDFTDVLNVKEEETLNFNLDL